MLFEGKKFIVTGNKIAKKQKEILERIIKKHGGVTVDDINECDVAISLNTTTSLDKPVVEPVYISKCIEKNSFLPIGAFLVKQNKQATSSERRDKSEEENSADEFQDPKKSYICFKKCLLNGPNEDIVKQLMIIKNHRYVTGNSRSELSYSKAISGLRALTHRIKSGERVFGMGPKITAYVTAFLETGAMPEVREIEESEEYQTLDKFCQNYGVGPKHAKEFYWKGYREVEDIPVFELTAHQQIGAKYYKDFKKPLTREECENLIALVSRLTAKVIGVCKVEATGGFRRGKKLNNDLDLIITHPSTPAADLCEQIIAELKKACLIQHILVHSKNHSKHEVDIERCFVVWKGMDRMHRVDLLFPSREQYPFAMLGWTGSRQFERSLRLYTTRELRWKLTSTGIFSIRTGHKIDISEVLGGRLVEKEEDIFEALGVPFLKPEERNC